MDKLTDDEKAKVFTMYFSAENIKVYGDLQDDYEQPNYGEVGLDYDNLEFSVSENMRLVLNSLADITDADAIEVARINGWNHSHTSAGKNIVSNFEKASPAEAYSVLNGMQTFQYLINKSYDVPLYFSPSHWANGKTAIELGIAIQSTNKN